MAPSQPFKPEFVEDIVTFFNGHFDELTVYERAHSAGVIANTLAAFAIHHDKIISENNLPFVEDTLSLLDPQTVERIGYMFDDPSVDLLWKGSHRLVTAVSMAIDARKARVEGVEA